MNKSLCYGSPITMTPAKGITLASFQAAYAAGWKPTPFKSLEEAKTECSRVGNCTGVVSTDGAHYAYTGDIALGPNSAAGDAKGTLYPVQACPASPRDPASSASPEGYDIYGNINNAWSSVGSAVGKLGGSSCPTPEQQKAAADAEASKKRNWTQGFFWTTVVVVLISAYLAYKYFGNSPQLAFGARAFYWALYTAIVALVAYGILFLVEGIKGEAAKSDNLAPMPVEYTKPVTIAAAQVPPQAGKNGGNYGMQWWMYIKDWDYKFGQEKPVFIRGPNGQQNPYVYLHPTENSLCVKINVYSARSGRGMRSSPGYPGADGSATDDSYTCVMKNVPLQTWFCVSLSLSGRNLDLYRDGRLVRSCVLSGVPRHPTGPLTIMPAGGFSGHVIDAYHLSRALTPTDAQYFCAQGTNGTKFDTLPSKPLFGYKVKLGVIDSKGKQIKQYTW